MRIIGKFLLTMVVALAGLITYLALTTSPIDSAAYVPPEKPPLTGALAPNTLLQQARLIAAGKIRGPEATVVDANGRIHSGTEDGRIVRITLGPTGQETIDTLANTGGRPLGLQFDRQGTLIVADAIKGLLAVDPQGRISTLATEAEGQPLGFTDDLDIADNGVIYFSDASSQFGYGVDLYDLMEAKPHGRLMAYDPATKKAQVLLDDLFFANGVALSPHEDFVLVNETFRYRITRYWLKGPKPGSWDYFIENLPGFPDNITSNRQGTFWAALFTVRNDLMDWLHAYPFLKNQLAKLPKAIWPKPQPYGLVLALNEQGKILQSLHDPTGEHLKEITAARQFGEVLYLGTLHDARIGQYRLTPSP
jgi:sugar lactone lactonase YvrE